MAGREGLLMHVVNAAPDRFTNSVRVVRGVQSFTARRGEGRRFSARSPRCGASLHARRNTRADHRNVTLLPCGRLIKFHFFILPFLFFFPRSGRERERERVSRAINTTFLLLFPALRFFGRNFQRKDAVSPITPDTASLWSISFYNKMGGGDRYNEGCWF